MTRAAGRLADRTERVDVRTSLAMLNAELHAAGGRAEEARRAVTGLLVRLAETQMTLAVLEARLLLLRLSATGHPSSLDTDARALESEARATGAGLIALRAQALRRP